MHKLLYCYLLMHIINETNRKSVVNMRTTRTCFAQLGGVKNGGFLRKKHSFLRGTESNASSMGGVGYGSLDNNLFFCYHWL